VVRVVGRYRQAPTFVFVRRAGSQLSATGEKLTETQLLAAMSSVSQRLALGGAPFTLRLVLEELPWYELAVEASTDATARAAALDEELARSNVEYASKRRSGRLAPPRVRLLPPGSYGQLRRAAVAAGTPEGQYKHPSMALDEASWERLLRAAVQVGSPKR
jgi:hypothetical protein